MTKTRALGAHWSREPLRVRLVVLITALLLVAIIAVGTLALTMLRTSLMSGVDDQLDGAAQSLVAQAERSRPWEQETPERDNPLIPTEYAVLIADSEGRILLTNTTAGTTPDVGSLALADVVARRGKAFTAASESGSTRWRVITRPTQDASGEVVGTAAVALPLTTVDATMRWMAGAIMAVGAGVLVVAAVAAYVVVRASLRPLRQIEATAATIAGGDLSQRVTPHPETTEVGSLAASLNTMLADLEAAFDARRQGEERLQRFVGDASHELRTPLAAVRGYTELYRLGGIPGDAVPDVMGRIEESATRMTALVADLLALARLDQEVPLRVAPLPVAEVLSDAALDARALDATRPVTVSAPAGLRVLADRDAARQIVLNLVANAVAYTPAGSPLELVAHDGEGPGKVAAGAGAGAEDPRTGSIEVRDHGPGIPAADRERVFERFARLDSGRSRDAGGSGLGLAIARETARRLGGDLTCEATPGGGATFRLTLPIATESTADSTAGSSAGPAVGPITGPPSESSNEPSNGAAGASAGTSPTEPPAANP